jgi:hypothetical protein
VTPLLRSVLFGRQRVGEVVPGDDRDDRVDPGVERRDGVLDLAAVGAADHADPRVAGGLLGDVADPAGAAGAVVERVAAGAGEDVDHAAAGLAVVLRVVERDLAGGGAEPETGVGEHHVALVDEALPDGGLVAVVLASAEPVGGEDRGRLVGGADVVRLVDVGADRARLVVVRAGPHLDGDRGDRVAGRRVGGLRGWLGDEGEAGDGERAGGEAGGEAGATDGHVPSQEMVTHQ